MVDTLQDEHVLRRFRAVVDELYGDRLERLVLFERTPLMLAVCQDGLDL